MGLRGPLRSPNSRRGQQEIRKAQRLAEQTQKQVETPKVITAASPVAAGDLPTPPACFSRSQAETFNNLVIDLLAAKVPLKRVDGHSIAMAVRCISAIEDAESIVNSGEANFDQRLAASRLVYQHSSSLKDWLDRICATVPTRARIGLKAQPEKKAGPLAALIAARQGQRGS